MGRHKSAAVEIDQNRTVPRAVGPAYQPDIGGSGSGIDLPLSHGRALYGRLVMLGRGKGFCDEGSCKQFFSQLAAFLWVKRNTSFYHFW